MEKQLSKAQLSGLVFSRLIVEISALLALGSYWEVIPALLIIPILVARILNEESLLVKELKGYVDYLQDTRYRLIPGVW